MSTRSLATQAKTVSTPTPIYTAARPTPLRRRSAKQTATDSVPPMVHEVLRSPGRPLDPSTRRFMEPRFGHDFSRVRIHDGTQAAESAKAVKAAAYTVGNHVVFGAGQYAPETDAGQSLLAHELVHVMQQSRHPEIQPGQLNISSQDDQHERAAEGARQLTLKSAPRPEALRLQPAT